MNETPFPEPLDIQHDTDPAQEQPPARRIPHLGHTLFYFGLNFFCIVLAQVIALAMVHARAGSKVTEHPHAVAAGMAAGYVFTLAISFAVFPFVWGRSFPDGVHWNLRAARLNWWKLAGAGVCIAFAAQVVMQHLPPVTENDLLLLLNTPFSAWTTVIVGSFLPPIAEELAFRGFLLPSLATAYDWLSLERTPAAAAHWTQTTAHSTPAWVFGSFFSSLLFAWLHASQYGNSIAAVSVLFVVSCVFSFVRIRLHSVCASSIVHITYNAVPIVIAIVQTGGFRHLDKLT